MSHVYTERRACRACDGPIETVLDLGPIRLSGFPRPDAIDPPPVPLVLTVCDRCGLVQLAHTVDPDQLYQEYWYQSGINEIMRHELHDLAQAAWTHLGELHPGDVVMDVGANDGTGLSFFAHRHLHRIAVEPSTTFLDRLGRQVETVAAGYFPAATAIYPARTVRLLLSTAMFYDLDDPRAAVAEVDRLLHPDGLWIVQMQDLVQMLAATAFDNICHEHLGYYTLRTFEALLEGADLRVTRVERRAINGGSLRIFVERRGALVDRTVALLRAIEVGGADWHALEAFAARAHATRAVLQAIVDRFAPVDLYGASTKANTWLQWAGFGPEQIRVAAERSQEKVGRVTAGSRIPIVSETTWRADPRLVTLVGIWQFRSGVLDREAGYLQDGGSFVFPLPLVDVVSRGR